MSNLRRIDSKRRRDPLPAVAPLDPFTHRQIEMIRLGRMTAWLVSAGQRAPKPESLRQIRRLARVLDGDGNDTGETLIETTSIIVTLREVSAPMYLDELADRHAAMCGFRKCSALREAWLARHPRTEYVRHIAFRVGDIRDRDWFMDRVGGYTMSPAQSIDPDAPVPIIDAVDWSLRNRLTEVQRERKLRSVGLQAKRVAANDLNEIRRLRDELDSLIDEGEAVA